MSFDLAVWYPHRRVTSGEAGAIYTALCEGQPSGLEPHAAIQAFYEELYALHPEIDDIPEERVGDPAYCPWSCAHDRSPAHMVMSSAWSQAEAVHATVTRLARKHGLAVYDPQSAKITYPDGVDSATSKPWWKFW